jgi:thiamine monophosphate synthase
MREDESEIVEIGKKKRLKRKRHEWVHQSLKISTSVHIDYYVKKCALQNADYILFYDRVQKLNGWFP